MKSVWKKPIVILIAVNLLIGVFIFRDYGLTWDEPYFYSYGDALGYAYNPVNWLSGHFDLNNSYGISGDDHKTRGPAYLFLARTFVYGLETLGSDSASAWHLINFLFFQLGIYFLYRLARHWLQTPAAFATTLLFSTQPLLWGHAFINPKDPPFLTFFLASVCLGFEMVDQILDETNTQKQKIFSVLLAALALGIATSIRVLGPLAGLLVFIYFLALILQNKKMTSAPLWRLFIAYGVVAMLVMLITWPYLWEDPLVNFINVFRFMSDNPTNLAVLFHGQVYRANALPLRYLPFMLLTTLTEPVWFLFIVGVAAAYWQVWKKQQTNYIVSITLIFLWLMILIVYVLAIRPAIYDGFRHFLFILPPVFIFIGFAFQFTFEQFKRVKFLGLGDKWLRAGILFILIFPSVISAIQLHPYEYTYYNSFVGGTDGAFRSYETDYWLTCYKDAVQQLEHKISAPTTLFVKREAYVAAPYADNNLQIIDLRGELSQVKSGNYVLVNTRTNEDKTTFKDAPIVIEIKRGNATFCIVRQIP